MLRLSQRSLPLKKQTPPLSRRVVRSSREFCRRQSHAGRELPKGDDPKTDHRKGLDSNLPGWQPKETASKLPSRADCFINATLLRRPEAVEWAPLVGRPADYLPSGTVGQWLPAPCNGGPC